MTKLCIPSFKAVRDRFRIVTQKFSSTTLLTSRGPYRSFGHHFRVSFVIGEIMSDYVIFCQLMLFMSNHGILVKSCRHSRRSACQSCHHSCLLVIKCVIGGVVNIVVREGGVKKSIKGLWRTALLSDEGKKKFGDQLRQDIEVEEKMDII
jgi:hypothetical protein